MEPGPFDANDAPMAKAECCEHCADRVTSRDLAQVTDALRDVAAAVRERRVIEPDLEQGPWANKASSLRVRRAAARVRLHVDQSMGDTTPSWIRRLAEEPENDI